jgi:hypothetical protein
MATNLIPLSTILPSPHHIKGIAFITLSTDQLAQSPKDPLLDARTEPPCYVAGMHFLFPVTEVLPRPTRSHFHMSEIQHWVGYPYVRSANSSMIRHESPLQSPKSTRRAAHVTLIDLVSSILLHILDNVKNTGYCHLLGGTNLLRQHSSLDNGDFWQLLFDGIW